MLKKKSDQFVMKKIKKLAKEERFLMSEVIKYLDEVDKVIQSYMQ